MAGNLSLKCVGTLITWPYMAGGRSRRGSPKAGRPTTVLRNATRRTARASVANCACASVDV